MYGEDAFYPETREPGRGELENIMILGRRENRPE